MFSIRRIKFLLALILIFLFFLAFSNREIYLIFKNNTKYNTILSNLQILDREIYLKFNTNFSNFDNLDFVNSLDNFDNNLTYLKKMYNFDNFVSILDIEKDINFLSEILAQKKDLADKLKFLYSNAISSLNDMQKQIDKDSSLNNFKYLIFKIKNINVLDVNFLKIIEKDIDFILNNNINNLKYINLVDKIKITLNSISSFQLISKQIIDLSLSKHIEGLINKYNVLYENFSIKIQYILVFSLLCFLILILFIYLQLRNNEQKLREIAMLKTAIDNDFSSIIFVNEDNKIIYANETFEKSSGYSLAEVKGKNPSLLKSSIHSPKFYQEMSDTIYNGKKWRSNELISVSKDSKLIHEKVNFVPFIFNKVMYGHIAIKLDRTNEVNILRELKIKNEQIKAQAIIDKLTGFGNYFAMTQRLDSKSDGIVIHITIKNFSSIRFFYQTKIIEAMLLSFANTLKLCVNTFKMDADLFRFQNDDFYLWYRGHDIDRDISYIQDYFNFSSFEVSVDDRIENLPSPKTIIGVSSLSDTMQTSRLMQAILANQQACDNGSDLYYYRENDAIELRYYQNQLIIQLIEYALENNTIIVECQGIYDISGEHFNIQAYEVLVRIIDQNGKIRYPSEFLDVAVQSQLYTKLTKKIIEKAFALVESYRNFNFSINLSSLDISDISVRELIEEKLKLCSNPSHVCFEMLESADINDYALIISFIKRIKSYGAKISIDDFGSGYSNYYRILELDIDHIKIDGSIIKKLPFDQNARYLVETIVNFASKQGYKIIAEFVSTPEILQEVKKYNIRYAQGFLLGKPKSLDNI